jgi:hypothetical protein
MWAQCLIGMGTCGISSQKAKLSSYLCTGVLARGNGAMSAEFRPPFDGHVIKNAIA